jgi:hypothetical protein
MELGVAKTRLFQLLITYKDNPLRMVFNCALTTVAWAKRWSLELLNCELNIDVMLANTYMTNLKYGMMFSP